MNIKGKGKRDPMLYSTKPDSKGKEAVLFHSRQLTQEEKDTGIITRPVPDDAAYFKIYFKNRYGTWTHTMIHI